MSRLTSKVCNDYFTTGAVGLNSWTNVLKNRLVYKLGLYEDKGEPEELVKVVRCGECTQYRLLRTMPDVSYGRCAILDTNMKSDNYCSYGRTKEAQP